MLREFRTRLVAGHAEQWLLDALLEQCRARKLLRAQGWQRTDSTHVLGAIRVLNRIECTVETLRHTLNRLAVVTPKWLRTYRQPEWLERYGPRVEDYRLPKGDPQRQAHACTVGLGGFAWLDAIDAGGLLNGSASCQPWRRSAACGCSNTIAPQKGYGGALRPKGCHQPHA